MPHTLARGRARVWLETTAPGHAPDRSDQSNPDRRAAHRQRAADDRVDRAGAPPPPLRRFPAGPITPRRAIDGSARRCRGRRGEVRPLAASGFVGARPGIKSFADIPNRRGPQRMAVPRSPNASDGVRLAFRIRSFDGSTTIQIARRSAVSDANQQPIADQPPERGRGWQSPGPVHLAHPVIPGIGCAQVASVIYYHASGPVVPDQGRRTPIANVQSNAPFPHSRRQCWSSPPYSPCGCTDYPYRQCIPCRARRQRRLRECQAGPGRGSAGAAADPHLGSRGGGDYFGPIDPANTDVPGFGAGNTPRTRPAQLLGGRPRQLKLRERRLRRGLDRQSARSTTRRGPWHRTGPQTGPTGCSRQASGYKCSRAGRDSMAVRGSRHTANGSLMRDRPKAV